MNIHETAIIHDNVTLGNNVTIGAYCVIGSPGAIRNSEKRNGEVYIGDNTVIQNHVCIMVGEEGVTRIGKNNLIMNYVNIGHNCYIGDNNEIGVGTIMGGWSRMEDNNKIKLRCTIRNRVSIGGNNLVGMCSNVVKSILSHKVCYGNPAREIS